MSGLFKKPKPQKIPAPEPPPSPIMVDTDRVSRENTDRLRRKRGRASTILSGGLGDSAGAVGLKKALGA
jgi:hypothetical protein